STTAKSKRTKAIDAPFAPDILKRARGIAEKYQVVLQIEDGEFFGRGLEMPMVMNDGKTANECVKKTRESLVSAVAYLLESGKVPPAPAADQMRSVQVNVRLTVSEKELLEQGAQRSGFRGLSDFVRHAALSSIGSN
ncbi:MAG TPA: hypothetical protein VGN88_05010, partial [Phycisphaerae bacterium]